MRLGPDVLVEIVSIVQDGLLYDKDVSQLLRDIELEVDVTGQKVRLTKHYLNMRGRDRDEQ